MNTMQVIKAAKRVSTPLVAVSTTDQQALTSALVESLNGNTPIVAWDAVRGYRPANNAGDEMLQTSGISPDDLTMSATNPVESLRLAADMKERTVIVWHNAPLFLDDPFVRQAIANLRDIFKVDGRMLLMTGAMIDLPVELQPDVISVTDEPPTDDSVAAMVRELAESAGVTLADDAVNETVDAVRGAGSLFGAEQIASMALRQDGIDLQDAWDRKIDKVNTVKGLTMTVGEEEQKVGGLRAIVEYFEKLMRDTNPNKPRAVVFIDEIEKALGGLGSDGGPGDNTGITQALLRMILTWMDGGGSRSRNQGCLLVGPPGTGKSLTGQNIAARHKLPMFTLNPGEAKQSLAGASEENYRVIFNTIDSVASGASIVIATCNKLDVLPPELRRRFTAGTWYLDLPDEVERNDILKIHARKLNADQVDQNGANLDGWTGAEIRNVCDLAESLGVKISEAAKYVVPVIQADPSSVERLRDMASGRWLSASTPGAYRKPVTGATAPRRQLNVEDA